MHNSERENMATASRSQLMRELDSGFCPAKGGMDSGLNEAMEGMAQFDLGKMLGLGKRVRFVFCAEFNRKPFLLPIGKLIGLAQKQDDGTDFAGVRLLNLAGNLDFARFHGIIANGGRDRERNIRSR